jgi:hypothetical protein
MTSTPIVFYFPYQTVGGVSVLFLRITSFIYDSKRIILMDLENGFMAKNKSKNVKFISYDKIENIQNNVEI